MTAEELREQLARMEAMVRALQQELAESNRRLAAVTLGLEQRIDERDARLRAANAALEQSNTRLAGTEAMVRALREELSETNRGLVALTLDLEQRVDARTSELRQLNLELEARVQERTAQLRQANDNLQNFAHSAAHDLRAPLRAIKSFSHIVLDEYAPQLDPQGQSLLQRITQSAAQMQQLLDDLLEYSKIGQEELRLEPVSLQDAVRDALAMLEADVHAKEASVTVEDSLPQIIGHSATLVLLINNLVSNALKFVSPGVAPRIRIRAEEVRSAECGMRNPSERGAPGAQGASQAQEGHMACPPDSALRIPHSALRTPHSALRTPHSALRTWNGPPVGGGQRHWHRVQRPEQGLSGLPASARQRPLSRHRVGSGHRPQGRRAHGRLRGREIPTGRRQPLLGGPAPSRSVPRSTSRGAAFVGQGRKAAQHRRGEGGAFHFLGQPLLIPKG